MIAKAQPKFMLGQIVATPGALEAPKTPVRVPLVFCTVMHGAVGEISIRRIVRRMKTH